MLEKEFLYKVEINTEKNWNTKIVKVFDDKDLIARFKTIHSIEALCVFIIINLFQT